MLKKTITYQTVDGEEITEDFYFNLSKPEVAEMELSMEGGWSTYLQSIVTSKNGAEIVAAFKGIISSSIGRRSEDGKRFVKSDEIANEFLQSDAWTVLFMQFVTDAGAAAEFAKGILPADMMKQFEQEQKNAGQPVKEVPAYILEDRDPTNVELAAMSPDELREAFQRKNKKNIGD